MVKQNIKNIIAIRLKELIKERNNAPAHSFDHIYLGSFTSNPAICTSLRLKELILWKETF